MTQWKMTSAIVAGVAALVTVEAQAKQYEPVSLYSEAPERLSSSSSRRCDYRRRQQLFELIQQFELQFLIEPLVELIQQLELQLVFEPFGLASARTLRVEELSLRLRDRRVARIQYEMGRFRRPISSLDA